MEPCAVTIQKRRLKWLGHVLRMKEDAIPNAALEFDKGHPRAEPEKRGERLSKTN